MNGDQQSFDVGLSTGMVPGVTHVGKARSREVSTIVATHQAPEIGPTLSPLEQKYLYFARPLFWLVRSQMRDYAPARIGTRVGDVAIGPAECFRCRAETCHRWKLLALRPKTWGIQCYECSPELQRVNDAEE